MGNLSQKVKEKYLRSLNNYPDSITRGGNHQFKQVPLSDELKQAVHKGMKGKDDPNIDSMMNNIPPEQHREVEPVKPATSPQRQSLSISQRDGWDKPVLFDSRKLPAFDTNILPDYCKTFVDELAEEMQVPADMPAMAVLGVLSSCVFGKFHVHIRGTWTEPLNIYTLIAMPPSSKKTPVHNAVTQAIRDFESNKRDSAKDNAIHARGEIKAKEKAIEGFNAEYKKARENGKGQEVLDRINELNSEIERLRPEAVLPTYIIGGDATPERVADLLAGNNERLSVISQEGNDLFSMLSGRYTDKPNLELFLQAYDGTSYDMLRVRRDVSLKNPLINILLFVQNSVIENSDRSFKDRGLMQRFLYCLPESNLGHRKIRPALMSGDVKSEFNREIRLRMQWEPKGSTELTLSPEADEILKSLETINEKLQGDSDVEDAYKEWRGKLIGNIIRIAGVLHTGDWFNAEHTGKEISGETFEKAASLYSYLSAHAEKAFDIAGNRQDETDAKKLFGFILEMQKGGKVERREITDHRRYFRREGGSKKLDLAAADLNERNIIHIAALGNSQKLVYELNPYIIGTLKKRTQRTQ